MRMRCVCGLHSAAGSCSLLTTACPVPPSAQPCPVCLCKLSEASDYQTVDLGLDLVQMLKCSHRLHRLCFQQYLQSQTSSPVSWVGGELGEGLKGNVGGGVMSGVLPSAVWHPLSDLQEDTWCQSW